MGKIGGGIALAVIGAILAFAVRDAFDAIDLTMIGYILLAGGAALIIIGSVLSARGDKIQSSVKSTGPGGDQITTREDRIT